MSSADEVLAYWLEELGEQGWYAGGAELDAAIRARFRPVWTEAMAGGLRDWLCHPQGVLAYLVVTDQMPRNMFRGTADAYRSDRLALAAAKRAVGRDWDLKVEPPARQFFYLPFMHSESLSDQEACIRLFLLRMPPAPDNLLHAQAHREVIRRFGRFPYRNDHLGRASTEAERAYLAEGGYMATVKALKPALPA